MNKISLEILADNDREQFIKDNQYAFLYGATKEFGIRDEHYEEEGEIISRSTIETAIDGESAETYRIIVDGKKLGGLVLNIDEKNKKGELELLFVSPEVHSKGIGQKAWYLVEKIHPEIKIWETMTPYFETRNIHFYVNCCGFKIVEYFNSHHPAPYDNEKEDFDGMFRFEKIITN